MKLSEVFKILLACRQKKLRNPLPILIDAVIDSYLASLNNNVCALASSSDKNEISRFKHSVNYYKHALINAALSPHVVCSARARTRLKSEAAYLPEPLAGEIHQYIKEIESGKRPANIPAQTHEDDFFHTLSHHPHIETAGGLEEFLFNFAAARIHFGKGDTLEEKFCPVTGKKLLPRVAREILEVAKTDPHYGPTAMALLGKDPVAETRISPVSKAPFLSLGSTPQTVICGELPIPVTPVEKGDTAEKRARAHSEAASVAQEWVKKSDGVASDKTRAVLENPGLGRKIYLKWQESRQESADQEDQRPALKIA